LLLRARTYSKKILRPIGFLLGKDFCGSRLSELFLGLVDARLLRFDLGIEISDRRISGRLVPVPAPPPTGSGAGLSPPAIRLRRPADCR
jgi:hypothetical protein